MSGSIYHPGEKGEKMPYYEVMCHYRLNLEIEKIESIQRKAKESNIFNISELMTIDHRMEIEKMDIKAYKAKLNENEQKKKEKEQKGQQMIQI